MLNSGDSKYSVGFNKKSIMMVKLKTVKLYVYFTKTTHKIDDDVQDKWSKDDFDFK